MSPVGRFRLTANSGIGGIVGVDQSTPLGMRVITVPAGYVSGSALVENSTWNNQTLGGLGVTPGSYIWTWGNGASADSFTLNIEGPSVPEPSSRLLFRVALAALLAGRMNRRIHDAG